MCVRLTLHLCSYSSVHCFEFRGKFLNLSLPFSDEWRGHFLIGNKETPNNHSKLSEWETAFRPKSWSLWAGSPHPPAFSGSYARIKTSWFGPQQAKLRLRRQAFASTNVCCCGSLSFYTLTHTLLHRHLQRHGMWRYEEQVKSFEGLWVPFVSLIICCKWYVSY